MIIKVLRSIVDTMTENNLGYTKEEVGTTQFVWEGQWHFGLER